MKILLIEPHKPLGDLYATYLRKEGHEVVLSHSAQDAVLAADDSAPDLVVLELQLPGHSGVEFLYEFRSYADWQNVPIVLHTLVPAHELKLSPQLGQIEHLYKPKTTLQQLGQVITKQLQPA